MSNTNSPYGFKPKVHARGGVLRPSQVPYQIASALGSNIYRGSPVIPVNTNRRINVAAATNRLLGVFQGCSYVDAEGGVQFRPRWASGTVLKTGTICEAIVWDDPGILYSAQVDDTDGLVADDIGNFADIIIGGGSAQTGQSSDQVDQSTLGTSDGQVKIMALDPTVGNDYGQYAKALVQFNETYAGPDTTAGNSLTAI